MCACLSSFNLNFLAYDLHRSLLPGFLLFIVILGVSLKLSYCILYNFETNFPIAKYITVHEKSAWIV